ncbi:hypothetical protein GN956_G12997 [Arapaima gigas]
MSWRVRPATPGCRICATIGRQTPGDEDPLKTPTPQRLGQVGGDVCAPESYSVEPVPGNTPCAGEIKMKH